MDRTSEPHDLVHRLRELVVQLDLIGDGFARAHSLHATDLRALICLLDSERAGIDCTPGHLGENLGLNSASTTALIDRLEKRELVARRRDTRDRRRVIVEVSDAARELGRSFFGEIIDRASSAIGTFSSDERDTVGRFLGAVTVAVRSGDDESLRRE